MSLPEAPVPHSAILFGFGGPTHISHATHRRAFRRRTATAGFRLCSRGRDGSMRPSTQPHDVAGSIIGMKR